MNTNIIAWALIGLAFASLWHFVYEAILLPSIRQNLRHKIFALRDRLRAFKAENPAQCSDETFGLMDEQLSWLIHNLPKITFSLVSQSERLLKRNAELRDEVAQRVKILKGCQLNEYVEIRKEAAELTMRTLAYNSGGWIVYLVPIVYPVLWWDKLSKRAQRATSLPVHEFDHMRGYVA